MSRILFAIMIAALVAGCSSRRVHHISETRFSPAPKSAEIKLFVNDAMRPHVKVAHVQSFPSGSRDSETRRRQLEELRERARKLGGEAVVGIRQLSVRSRGLVEDERAPIPMVRHGESTRYVLRGTVIRYAEDDGTGMVTDDPSVEAAGGGIPSVDTIDPEESLPYDPSPSGLRITID